MVYVAVLVPLSPTFFSRALLFCSRSAALFLLLSVAITRPCPGAVRLQRSAVSSALSSTPVVYVSLLFPLSPTFFLVLCSFPRFAALFISLSVVIPYTRPCPGTVHLERSAGVQCVLFSAPVVNVRVLLTFTLLLYFCFLFLLCFLPCLFVSCSATGSCPGAVHLQRSTDVQCVVFSTPVVNVLTCTYYTSCNSFFLLLDLFAVASFSYFRSTFTFLSRRSCNTMSWRRPSIVIG